MRASEEVAAIHVGIGLIRHLLDVGAGSEGLGRAGQDDAADAVVIGHALEEVAQFAGQGGVQRVQRLGPVQGDDRIAVRAAFDQQGGIGVGHQALLSTRSGQV